jgi:hypothetical protein
LSIKFEEQEEKIAEIEEENKSLRKELVIQNSKIENLEQYGRRNNVLFDFLTEEEEENTDELVIEQCKKVGINITKADLQATHRLGKKTEKNRSVIARFTSVDKARKVLVAAKGQFKGGNKPHNPVQAREDLTEGRRHVLKELLKLKKAKQITNVWVYNFELYIKVNKENQGKKIQTLDELRRLI